MKSFTFCQNTEIQDLRVDLEQPSLFSGPVEHCLRYKRSPEEKRDDVLQGPDSRLYASEDIEEPPDDTLHLRLPSTSPIPAPERINFDPVGNLILVDVPKRNALSSAWVTRRPLDLPFHLASSR
jgi:hypothetical protein